MKCKKILFVKPPDRYLEDEFVYQQLGPHYLQSFLAQCEIPSDILVLYERSTARENRLIGLVENPSISDLNMLYLDSDGRSLDESFDHAIFSNYDIIGMSVMSPQAPDAYMLVELINHTYPEITTVIGGSHPRYYRDQVESLPPPLAFDFIVPQDGWVPMFNIATDKVKKQEKSQVLIDNIGSRSLAYRPITQLLRSDVRLRATSASLGLKASVCFPNACSITISLS